MTSSALTGADIVSSIGAMKACRKLGDGVSPGLTDGKMPPSYTKEYLTAEGNLGRKSTGHRSPKLALLGLQP